MAKVEVQKDWLQRLVDLSDSLESAADDFFDVGDGSDNRSRQRTDAEVTLHGQIKHLAGYIDSIRDEAKAE